MPGGRKQKNAQQSRCAVVTVLAIFIRGKPMTVRMDVVSKFRRDKYVTPVAIRFVNLQLELT